MSRAPFVAMLTDLRKEERVRFTADHCGYNEDEAIGKFFRLWSWCVDRGLDDAPDDCDGYAVSEPVVRRFLGARGVEGILGDGCDDLAMGMRRPDGLIYLRGTSETVGRLRGLRSSAVAGGRSRASSAVRNGEGKFAISDTSVQLTRQPQPAVSSEIPPPTSHFPEDQIPDPPPARAIPPVVAEPDAKQASAPEPATLPPPTRLPVAWSGPPDHRALAARKALARGIRDAVNAARRRASEAIPGARFRPLDDQDPGERPLSQYIVGASSLDDARETLLYVVEMAETEAIAKKSLQWLTLSAIFSEKNRTRFAGGSKAEYERPDPRAPDIAAIRATPAEMDTARAVLEQLSEGSSKGPAPIVWRVEDGHAAIVVQRLRELEAVRPGYGHAELCAVAAVACDDFEGKDRTRKLLTPGFVFGPGKFAELLTTARATYAANIEERTAERTAAGRRAAP